MKRDPGAIQFGTVHNGKVFGCGKTWNLNSELNRLSFGYSSPLAGTAGEKREGARVHSHRQRWHASPAAPATVGTAGEKRKVPEFTHIVNAGTLPLPFPPRWERQGKIGRF
jgi:hypothetical protein